MCPYKGQREETTISLDVLAMILKQCVGKPSLLQRYTASLRSTCSAWAPASNVLQSCFPVSQPPDFVLDGLIPHHIVYVWVELVLFVVVWHSISPASWDPSKKLKDPSKNCPALCPASCSFLLGLNLVFAHSCQSPNHYLQENTLKQGNDHKEMSFITGYQWDFTEPASPVIWLHTLYSTHLVYWLDLDF